jgi:hypothetical protein
VDSSGNRHRLFQMLFIFSVRQNSKTSPRKWDEYRKGRTELQIRREKRSKKSRKHRVKQSEINEVIPCHYAIGSPSVKKDFWLVGWSCWWSMAWTMSPVLGTLYHLSHTPSPFQSLLFEYGLKFLPEANLDHDPPCLWFLCSWNVRHVPPHSAFSGWDGFSWTFCCCKPWFSWSLPPK